MSIIRTVLLAGCSLVVPAIFISLFGTLPQYWGYALSSEYKSFLMLLAPLLNIPVIVFFKRKYGVDLYIKMGLPSIKTFLLLSLLSVSVFFMIPLIIHPVVFVKMLLQGKINIIIPEIELLSASFVIFSLGKVLVAPVIEEVIFRGIVYDLLKRTYSIKFSVFFSSLLFVLVHFDFTSISILLFIYSIFFCFVYENTNSLIAPIFLHALINLMSQTTTTSSIQTSTINQVIYLLMILVCFAAIVFIVRTVRKSKTV